jgi:penicillin-binding protein 1C
LKPFIYALAFEDRTLHPETLVEDVPVRFKDWLPRNFDRDHQGAVTARRALQQSLNVPAVLALEKVGPDRFLKTLRAAGADPGVAKDEVRASLGVALGSASISPLEMAGLYSGLANGGRFAPPTVRRDRPRAEPVRLVGSAASWYVADILSDAPLPEGFAALPPALRERRIAYKTGTSAGFRGVQRQLDSRGVGRPSRWRLTRGPARPPLCAADRIQGLRPPARRGQSRRADAGRCNARVIVARAASAHAHPRAERRRR